MRSGRNIDMKPKEKIVLRMQKKVIVFDGLIVYVKFINECYF